MKNMKKQKPDIECIDCHKIYVAMPIIPICRLCGGLIKVSQSFLDLLPNNDNENEND